jgi:NAD(P)-dependent dehydrogenase (short-subunit alcohol dehydrogenase family)
MKSVIITGATGGIGFECAMHMASIAQDAQIIIACRNPEAGKHIIQTIQQKTGHKHLLCMPLDLDSLASVSNFKEQFSKDKNPQIIALINNAGMQNITKTQYTKDGFESTFGVNHLASFYLTLLLLPFMDSNGSITFTASGVHDPKQKTGIEPPVFKRAEELAHPDVTAEKLNIVGQRRYATSKLCNILTTYELQRRLSSTDIRVNAFDPGLVPGTGLARTYSPLLRFVWNYIFPLLKYFVHNVNTAQHSGKRLADLAYSEQYRGCKGKYFEGTKEIASSTDSYNQDFQRILWNSSVELLGIKQSDTAVYLE